MSLQVELILLVVSVLFFLSILAGKASSRFGVPALLLFLGVGMMSGSDGLGIQFENIQFANSIGTVALCIILFSGGLDTKTSEIRPILAQGVVLATLGVLLTAISTGVIIWWVLGLTMKAAGIGFLTSNLPLVCTTRGKLSVDCIDIWRQYNFSLRHFLLLKIPPSKPNILKACTF